MRSESVCSESCAGADSDSGFAVGDILHALRSAPFDRLVFPPWLLALASSIVFFLRPDARAERNFIGHPPPTGATLNSVVQRFFPPSLSHKRRQDLLCDVIKSSVQSEERRTELVNEVKTLDHVEFTAPKIRLPQLGQPRIPRTIVQHQDEERRVWEFWLQAWQSGIFPSYREDAKEASACLDWFASSPPRFTRLSGAHTYPCR